MGPSGTFHWNKNWCAFRIFWRTHFVSVEQKMSEQTLVANEKYRVFCSTGTFHWNKMSEQELSRKLCKSNRKACQFGLFLEHSTQVCASETQKKKSANGTNICSALFHYLMCLYCIVPYLFASIDRSKGTGRLTGGGKENHKCMVYNTTNFMVKKKGKSGKTVGNSHPKVAKISM